MASDTKAGFMLVILVAERSVMGADDIAAADKATSTVGGRMGARARDSLSRGKILLPELLTDLWEQEMLTS